jgi:3-hydroxypropanoate dehydrogenase
MGTPLNETCFDALFVKARTYSYFLDRAVTDETLRRLYDLLKWGPTSVNGCPGRFVFVRTPESKSRLLPALSPGNVEKTKSAPVTVIVGHDTRFYNRLDKLWPHGGEIRTRFAACPATTEETAFRNGTLQGAYLILAARALGLDCGPMSGFDNAAVDREFFGAAADPASTDQEFFVESTVKSNFLCNLGYGDPSRLHPRNPRLDFEEACTLI